MLVVGLTGNIGSGKTYVANLFEKKGVPIYNTDNRAKYLMNNSIEIIETLKEKFGTQAYQNKLLNRKLIADKIFQDKSLIKWMNQLIHPKVQKDFDNWLDNNKQSKYVLKEAAILIESGAYKNCDRLILVSAPDEIRISRVIERDKMTEAEVLQRMANQMPEADKKTFANYIINNDGIQLVEKQVNEIHNKLINTKI